MNIMFQKGERQVKVLIEYALMADLADEKAIPKQGTIKVVDYGDESKVICERVTQRTVTNKVDIRQEQD